MPEVEVKWLLPDGAGGAPLKQGSVRIPGALPGDVVRYREVDRRGRTVTGAVEAVLAPSPDRRESPCPFDASCGGCDLSAFAPEARREALGGIVQRAFHWPDPVAVVASPRQTGHRARIKLHVDGGRVGYRAARSHDLVAIDDCPAARPEVVDALRRLDPAVLTDVETVELRSDGERVVYAFTGRWAPDDLGDVALNGKPVSGDPTLYLDVAGHRLRASPLSFYQVNLEINALLVDHVRALVNRLAPERVLDLYSGIGNLTLPLAADGRPVVAVELEGQATRDLRANAGDLPITVHTGDASRWDPSREPFDVAVIDPPRTGCRGVIERLVRNRPRGIVYVACNPVAAARDCREAFDAGYRLTEVRAFEMFPDTHHIEAVLLLERGR